MITSWCKISYFHLISWCGNFVERHNFCIVSGDSQCDFAVFLEIVLASIFIKYNLLRYHETWEKIGITQWVKHRVFLKYKKVSFWIILCNYFIPFSSLSETGHLRWTSSALRQNDTKYLFHSARYIFEVYFNLKVSLNRVSYVE